MLMVMHEGLVLKRPNMEQRTKQHTIMLAVNTLQLTLASWISHAQNNCHVQLYTPE